MALSIGKAWDEARAAIAANRRLITPVALGLILVPAVVSAMFEPRVAPGIDAANSGENRPPTVETLTPTFSNTFPLI